MVLTSKDGSYGEKKLMKKNRKKIIKSKMFSVII